jgi:CubicO group peptidase (beta-lactamase class C family)
LVITLIIALAMVLPLGGAATSVAQDGGADPSGIDGSQCFTPVADAYAWDWYGSNRDLNTGGATSLDVASLGDVSRDQRYSFLRFDLSAIPAGSVVLATTLEMYLTDIDGTGVQTYTKLEAVEESWSEMTLTWNNRPNISDGTYDEQDVSDTVGWKSWDATWLASEWVTGARANYGLAVVSGGVGSPPAHFYSREGSTTNAPKLCVEWQAYADVLDLDSIGWRSGRNYSSSAFGSWFGELSGQGYMMVDIEVDEIDGQQRVGGVWQWNADGRAWYETRNMSLATYESYQQTRAEAGFRMIDQEVYTLSSQTYYAGIWIKNTENLRWVNYYDVPSSVFSALFSVYSGMGYMPIDVDAYEIGGELLYSAIWLDNFEGLDWHEWRDLTSQQFAEKFDEYRDQFRMIDVESYRYGGTQYYAGIWVENVNGRKWVEWRDMTSKGFGEKWAELRDAGYRLIDYEVYPTSSGWRYAGIWRQNSDRPDWVHKSDIDTILQGYFDNANLPGMSVAIAENGQFRYLRGFGDADLANDVATDSRTIYRLASVSKAVAGVLGMRLSEEGLIDLTNDTRDYVPTMPVHHTHTVSETLTNRAGLGHYCGDTVCDYPDWKTWVGGADEEPDHFATALDAAERLWDAPLSYPPPGSTYRYSTFGYTFTGAAMEGAVGSPIGDILEDYLQVPYGLDTLRVEDRSAPNAKRSLLYNKDNEEVAADDLTWKVLGGGLESSAYDLLRFGIKVNNGTILTSNSRTQLWTPPDSMANYGLGWNVGTQSGIDIVAKRGTQNGARAYIRIYPNADLVIVVLTNRSTGHDPIPLGQQIGAVVLGLTTAAAAAPSIPGAPAELEELIDEPDTEGLPAEDVVWPVSNPVAVPGPEDLEEQDDLQLWYVYLPAVIR